jgi:uncharacterized protein
MSLATPTTSASTPADPLSQPNSSLSGSAVGPVQGPERISTLDVLRGVALIGMFFVHFGWRSGPFSWDREGRVLDLLFANRFATMFAILMGAGFAVQLRRAEARGDRFAGRYARRLLALAVFGIIAEDFFGYGVLLGYAIWGLPLLLVRKLSVRALFITFLLCLMSRPIYGTARAAWDRATGGVERYRSDGGLCVALPLPSIRASATCNAEFGRLRALRQAQQASREAGRNSSNYLTAVRARLQNTWSGYVGGPPYWLLPTNDFALFLLGLMALRLGVFERPRQHRRLIAGLMVFGAACSAVSDWYWSWGLHPPAVATWPLPIQVLYGFVVVPLVQDVWLAFFYIGAVLLLVAENSAWLKRLEPFAVTGRMALTNYMLQVIILDLLFSKYGLDLSGKMDFIYAPVAAFALFAVDVVFCRWWLSRFRYGPFEWLWRSVTYWRLQPMRLALPQAVAE